MSSLHVEPERPGRPEPNPPPGRPPGPVDPGPRPNGGPELTRWAHWTVGPSKRGSTPVSGKKKGGRPPGPPNPGSAKPRPKPKKR
jgi:hypothetical protein